MQDFTITIAQEVLDDLQTRLARTRWPDEPAEAGWHYGSNMAYLRELVQYWRHEYDWRKHEAYLNSFPQYRVELQSIGIHFLYIKGRGNKSEPLILSHGWPDSFYRFMDVIPMLTDPARYGGDAAHAFDIIIPSIPGFAFSDKTALDDDHTAALWNELMTKVLGYQSYYAAGGDMGSGITKSLANQFPANVRAIHLTDVGYPDGSEDWSQMSPAEQEFGQYIQRWFFSEGGFNILQSTKPQTLAYGMHDSPVGLAAWIIEKFHGWSDNRGHIENCFSKDRLLTNIMIYWCSESINSSFRTYRKNAQAMYSGGLKSAQYVEVPTGVSIFPGEAPFPKEWIDRKVNCTRYTRPEKGGHFAAMEVPELFTRELRDFFYA